MKKKILFFAPLPPPHYGAAIMSKINKEILKESKDLEFKHIKLNYSKEMDDVGRINFSKIGGIFKVKNEIKSAINSFKPDLIYFAPATNGLGLIRDWLFIKQIKKYRIPIIFHIHSRLFNKKLNNLFYKKMFSGQKAIVLGEQLIEDVSDYIPKKDIFVLPNAIKNEISEKEFKEIIKKRQKNNSFNILFLSNMDTSKGWPKLLQACKILKQKNIKFNCNFVGDFQNEKDKQLFYNFIEKNNMKKEINYLGKKTGKEKNKILSESNILIFPTEYPLETFGVVIIEGMMFGLPVIANGIATIPSTIEDGKTGFVLRENSSNEIVQKILLLKDKKIREKMGKASRQRFLKNYEMTRYKESFKGIISSLF